MLKDEIDYNETEFLYFEITSEELKFYNETEYLMIEDSIVDSIGD